MRSYVPAAVGALFWANYVCGAQNIEFNRDIRPILSDKCFPCHGPDAANRKTKLRFDTEAGASITLHDGKRADCSGRSGAERTLPTRQLDQ